MIASMKIDITKSPVPRLAPTRACKPKTPSTEGAVIIELPFGYSDGHFEKALEPWNKGEKSQTDPPKKRATTPSTGRTKEWTPEKDRQLVDYYYEMLSDGEIADRMHMPQMAITKRIYRLRKGNGPLCNAPKRHKQREWTEDEHEQLISMYERGITFAEISVTLNKTIGACQTKIFELRKKGRVQIRRQ